MRDTSLPLNAPVHILGDPSPFLHLRTWSQLRYLTLVALL